MTTTTPAPVKQPWQMTSAEFDATNGVEIPARKQGDGTVLLMGQHEPMLRTRNHPSAFDDHGFFYSTNIPEHAWDHNSETAPDHPDLFRPQHEGVFVSIRDLDAALKTNAKNPTHHAMVHNAVKAGHPVPPHVRAEYPTLSNPPPAPEARYATSSPQQPPMPLKMQPFKVFRPVFSDNPTDHWVDGFQAGEFQIWPEGKHWVAKRHGPTGPPEHPYSLRLPTPEAALAFLQMPPEEQRAAKAKVKANHAAKQAATTPAAQPTPEARYTWYCDFLSRAGITPRPFDEWQALGPERYSMTAAEIDEAVKNWQPPTEAQREAENYRAPKINLHGLTISIETPRGERRRPEWPPVAAHYGRILGTVGADSEHLDVFVADHPESELVYVVDQEHRGGRWDEHKAIFGALNREEARRAYEDSYDDGRRAENITAMTVEQFREWIKSGDTRHRIAPQVSRYTAEDDPDSYPWSRYFDDLEAKYPGTKKRARNAKLSKLRDMQSGYAPGSENAIALQTKINELLVHEQSEQSGHGKFTNDPDTYWRIHPQAFTRDDLHKNHVARQWISGSGDRDAERKGLSVTGSLNSLAGYFAGWPHENAPGRSANFDGAHLVQLRGKPSGDTPFEEEEGESLIHPTKVIASIPIEQTDFPKRVAGVISKRWGKPYEHRDGYFVPSKESGAG